MNQSQRDELLARYGLGKTTPEEESQLLRAAIDDQSSFDAMAEEALARELMQDPVSRNILLDSLAPEPAWKRVLSRIVESRPAWALAGAVAMGVVAAVFVFHQPSRDTAVTTGAPARTLSSMEPLPARVRDAIAKGSPGERQLDLTIHQTTDGSGSSIQLVLTARTRCALVVVAERSDGSGRILFPNAWNTAADVRPGTAITIPPSGQKPLKIDGPAGTVRFTAAAYPPGTDVVAALQGTGDFPVPVSITTAEAEVK